MQSTGLPSTKSSNGPVEAEARSDSPWGLPDRAGFALAARVFPAGSRRTRASLCALLALCLLASAVALTAWRLSLPAEIDLLAESSSPNLNITSAERPAPELAPQPSLEIEAPSEPPVAEDVLPPEPEPLLVPEPIPVVPPPVVEAVRLPDLELAIPAKPEGILVPRSQPGDSIMMRNWRLLGWPGLLAAALAATPAPVQAQAEPDKITAPILKKLDEVQKSLEAELKKLTGFALDTDLKVNAANQDIVKLKEQVAQLSKDLAALKAQGLTRVALSPSTATSTGKIRLVNLYPEQMAVIVNQTAYRLAPGETRLIDAQPAGAFSYQVLGAQSTVQNRSLVANETFTITVYPR